MFASCGMLVVLVLFRWALRKERKGRLRAEAERDQLHQKVLKVTAPACRSDD